MAKSAGAKNKHTHVPSHIGFSVIGLVALVFGLLVVINYNAGSDRQTVESHASTVNTTTKQCISYNTSGKCLLYQSTTTKVNTSSPCVGYNTSGKCIQYQGTTQNTTTFVPTPVKNTVPQVVGTTGPGILVCKNGKPVGVGGAAYNESQAELNHICATNGNQNSLFLQGGKYTCSNVPAKYKSLAQQACK